MRLVAYVAAAGVFLQPSISFARQTSAAEPIVQIGIFGYRADGSNGSAAYDTEPSLNSRVYASGKLCQLGAGSRETPAWAMHAWRFSGRVLSKDREQVVLELTWQRTLDSGNEVPVPGSVTQLTLRNGDRVALDTVHGPADATCSTNVSFEARYMPRLTAVVRAFGAGGTGTGSFARGVDGASATGAAVGAAGGAGGVQAQASRRQMVADVWLVHSAPGRPDDVIHQAVRGSEEGADFSFAPIAIDSPRGKVVVQVSGSFGLADGQLTFITNRSVKYLFGAGRDGAAPDVQGTGRTVNAIPGRAEVLSFEMPPVPGAPGGVPLPDQFSVRVRILR